MTIRVGVLRHSSILCIFCMRKRLTCLDFKYVLQPFKQELSKKTEDKLHLEDVKIRQTGASARDDKKTVSY